MRIVRIGLAPLGFGLALSLAPGEADAQRRSRDLITREEILNSALVDTDVYQVIRSLRPHFLAPPRGVRTMGAAPPAPIALYVDGTRMGEVEHLRTLMARQVEEVRYLDPSRAENRFGITHNGGALLVTLLKSRRDSIPPPGPAARDG